MSSEILQPGSPWRDVGLTILRRLREGPVRYTRWAFFEWPTVLEFGIAGLVKWPKGGEDIEITLAGVQVLTDAEPAVGEVEVTVSEQTETTW